MLGRKIGLLHPALQTQNILLTTEINICEKYLLRFTAFSNPITCVAVGQCLTSSRLPCFYPHWSPNQANRVKMVCANCFSSSAFKMEWSCLFFSVYVQSNHPNHAIMAPQTDITSPLTLLPRFFILTDRQCKLFSIWDSSTMIRILK